MTGPVASSVDAWLDELRTAALVGSARREAPDPPAALGVVRRDEVAREQRVLEGAAYADVLLRTGTRLVPADAALEPAAPERRREASAAATQLAHLLLTQSPVSRSARDDLLVEWLRAADDADRRVAPRLLPALLAHAATRPEVAAALGGTLGERGRWLAALHPDWRSLLRRPLDGGPDALAPDWEQTWDALDTTTALAVFGQARRRDPAAARAVLERAWDSLPARLRADGVRLLATGISQDDEALLERGLDDRSKQVREAAWHALDLLPGSARAGRMEQRLRALLHLRGTLRRTLEVDVPDDPDGPGVRDGLAARTTGGVQPRTQWLATIIRGAPLSAWTDATGKDVQRTVEILRGDDRVLEALAATAIRRRDADWAAALLDRGLSSPDLLAVLPREQRSARIVAGLRKPKIDHAAAAMLHGEPRPWHPDLARAVLAAVTGSDAGPALSGTTALLAAGLPAELGPEVDAALRRLPPESRVRRALAENLQLTAFRMSITEAFR